MRSLVMVLVLLAGAATEAHAQRVTIADWVFNRNVDRMTDEDNSFIMTMNKEERSRITSLVVACFAGQRRPFVMHAYLGGDRSNRVEVTYRIDRNPPVGPDGWVLGSGKRSSVVPLMKRSSFIHALTEGREVVLRVRDPLDGEVVSAVFSLRGVTDALARLPC